MVKPEDLINMPFKGVYKGKKIDSNFAEISRDIFWDWVNSKATIKGVRILNPGEEMTLQDRANILNQVEEQGTKIYVRRTDTLLHPFALIIPSIRINDLKLALSGVLVSSIKPTDIILIICINDFYNDYQIRQFLSAFQSQGIKVHIKRSVKPTGIGLARATGINIAKKLGHDIGVFLDDDIILEYDTIERLLDIYQSEIDAPWVAPTVLIPSNEQNLPHWTNRRVSYKFTETRAKELLDEFPFAWQWNPIKDEENKRVWANVAMTACLVFNLKDIGDSTIKALSSWKGAGEDEYITKELGKGVIDLKSSVYHFVGQEQKRSWEAERKWLT